MWFDSLGGTLLLILHLLSPHDVLWYISVVADACVTIGSTSGLIVIAVPFGTGQMLGKKCLCSLVCLGLLYQSSQWSHGKRSLHCTGMRDDQTRLISMIFAVSSVALCIDILCRNWLVIVPMSQNPFGLFGVPLSRSLTALDI